MKIRVAISSEVREFDTVVYEDTLWLVPEWTATAANGRRPAWLIGGPGVYFEAWRGMGLLAHLKSKSPSLLFAGRIPEGEETLFSIRQGIDLEFPSPRLIAAA